MNLRVRPKSSIPFAFGLRPGPRPFSWVAALAAATAICGGGTTQAQVSEDAQSAMRRLRVAPGLKLEVFATEPLIQNITSVAFDHHGRAYVVETGRRRTSVFDIRNFRDWVEEDLALRTVPQRADYLRGMLATNDAFRAAATKSTRGGFQDFNRDGRVDVRDLEVESERVRLVWDSDHDGVADQAITLADGFNSSVSGVAAGILTEGSRVWFACIPDLWRFNLLDSAFVAGKTEAGAWKDRTVLNSKVAVERVATGFGVHIAYGGHDLHGLIKGPDGRIYFSIADRGTTVTNREGAVISVPDTGAVFRCEPDGGRLELFARGLRNPQELAFDAQGRLWTGDNNGDGGDKARWTWVLEGGDYGWSIGWQWLPKMGCWNSERLWHLPASNTATASIPPVAHVGHGPAGIAYYPGTGLGARFNNHFFYSDFPGGVRSFEVASRGSFFEVVNAGPWMEDNSAAQMNGKVLWDLSPVDVAFPPGGGLVVADWVEGWEKTGKGRLWRVMDPEVANDPLIAETRRLLDEGMAGRSETELRGLLGHRDQRVRLEAQWELARRITGDGPWNGSEAVRGSLRELASIALEGRGLARLHALWALGQVQRAPHQGPVMAPVLTVLQTLLRDADLDVRGAAARLFGQCRWLPALMPLSASLNLEPAGSLVPMLQALADYAEPGDAESAPSSTGARRIPDVSRGLVALMERPEAREPVVRHAAVRLTAAIQQNPTRFGLGGTADVIGLLKASTNSFARLVSVLAMRELGDARAAGLLTDEDPQVALEAAHGIYDTGMPGAQNLLAEWAQPERFEILRQRADNPAFGAESAVLSAFTPKPPYTGEEWIGYMLRRAVSAAVREGTEARARGLAELAAHAGVPVHVRVEALEGLGEWAAPSRKDRVLGVIRPVGVRSPEPARAALSRVWSSLIADPSAKAVVMAALQAAEKLQLPELGPALAALVGRKELGEEVSKMQARLGGGMETSDRLKGLLEGADVRERQRAFAVLGARADAETLALLKPWVDRLADRSLPTELQADVLEAARRRSEPFLRQLTQWTNGLPTGDALAAYQPALRGGDAASGRRIFFERQDIGCFRCHKWSGEGGDVGPELKGVGKSRGREAVLESIVRPNAQISPGFENVTLSLKNGTTVSGVLRKEAQGVLEVDAGEDGRMRIPVQDVVRRERGLSPMPENLVELLSLRELRDLVEFLCQE